MESNNHDRPETAEATVDSAGLTLIQKQLDKVSAVFVPLVVLLSGLTLLGWYWVTGSLETALIRAIAVLIIACPCALGLATPVSVRAGLGAAAKAGILFKNAEVMERAHRVTTVVFEKNGTLMESCPQILAIVSHTLSEDKLLQMAAEVLAGRDNPLARAVRRKAEEEGFSVSRGLGMNALLGRGWQGRVGEQLVLIGDRSLMHEHGIDLDPLALRSRECEIQGHSVFFMADQNHRTLLGMMVLSERVKDTAFDLIQKLNGLGLKTRMLTSGHRASAFLAARALGIHEIHDNVQPENKAEIIAALQARGESVAMVGERSEDTPALAVAQVGILFAKVGEIGSQGADVTLFRDDPHSIVDALYISRRTHATIKQNLLWAILYNLISIPLAASGRVHPSAAAIAMGLSSLLVVMNALRLGCWIVEPGRGDVRLVKGPAQTDCHFK